MRITIKASACQDEANWRHLDTIVGKVADDWHKWDVCAPEAIEASGWTSGRRWVAELIQKAALDESYRAKLDFPRRTIIVSDTPGAGALAPEAAARFVAKPLLIMMENRFSDGCLVNAALEFLAQEPVRKLKGKKAILYDSPGGNGELPKLIRDYAKKAEDEGLQLRAVVFTDSDAKVVGDVSQDALSIQHACDEAGMPCLIFCKRNIENYIPDEILEASLPYPGDKRRTLEALKRLDDVQRDHFPMKKGLKLANELSSEIKAFYQDVSPSDLNELQRGFGQDVINKLEDHSVILSAGALRRRDWRGDLDKLVKIIADEL